MLNTIIAWPAPSKRNTGGAHGSALGADEVAATKVLLGFDPSATFTVDDDVLAHVREVQERGRALRAEWNTKLSAWRAANPSRAELLDRLQAGKLPDQFESAIPEFAPDKPISTRAASGDVLNQLAEVMPELWGGSADLGESNMTTMKNQPSFLPENGRTGAWLGGPHGRTLHYGVREHAMAAIMSGMTLGGLTRPYGGTFLVFSDYQRPAVRLAALMKLPVTYVWSHDSIGLGEDGPTHQPVEHLASLRLIPGLDVVRPADGNETAVAWRTILERKHPAGLVLSRQALPVFDRSAMNAATGTARGGYTLVDSGKGGPPDVVLIATGSEVALAVEARTALEADGIATQVVSMPCVEWFNEQPSDYRDSVLPPAVTARVAIEAGSGTGWREMVHDGQIISLEHFGASADANQLFTEFGFTAKSIVHAARIARG